MFLTRCSHRSGISQADHRFLFAPHCLEKPTGEKQTDRTSWHLIKVSFPITIFLRACAFPASFISLTHSQAGNFMGLYANRKLFIQTQGLVQRFTYHSKVEYRVLFFKYSLVTAGFTRDGPGAGSDKREAFKLLWTMQRLPWKRIWSQPFMS